MDPSWERWSITQGQVLCLRIAHQRGTVGILLFAGEIGEERLGMVFREQGLQLHAQRKVGPLENAHPCFHRPQHHLLEALAVHLSDQRLDEGCKPPVGELPDCDPALLELPLKMFVQLGGKGVQSVGSRK